MAMMEPMEEEAAALLKGKSMSCETRGKIEQGSGQLTLPLSGGEPKEIAAASEGKYGLF